MVEKRGSVGESTFHVCFLMQTPTHLFLARRLLKHYPKLIKDVYRSEEYYGKYNLDTITIMKTTSGLFGMNSKELSPWTEQYILGPNSPFQSTSSTTSLLLTL